MMGGSYLNYCCRFDASLDWTTLTITCTLLLCYGVSWWPAHTAVLVRCEPAIWYCRFYAGMDLLLL